MNRNVFFLATQLRRFAIQKCGQEAFAPKATSLVFVGGPATHSAVARMQSMPRFAEKKFHIISSLAWVEETHRDWHDLAWGQSMRYLPAGMMTIASSLYPHYPHDKLMNCGMVKKLIETQRQLLKEKGVSFIEAQVDLMKETVDGLDIYTAGKRYPLVKNTDFHIFNGATKLNEPLHLARHDLSMQSFSSIYCKPRGIAGNYVVIVGSGLSADWAARDLKHRKVIHIIPPGDRERPDLHDSFYASIRMTEATTGIEFHRDGTVWIMGRNSIDGRLLEIRVPAEEVYLAMGSSPHISLVEAHKSKITMTSSVLKTNGTVNALDSTGSTIILTRGMGNTKIPNGNMSMKYLEILKTCGAIDMGDTKAIMYFEAWKETLIQKAHASRIQIEQAFFDKLNVLIQEHHTHTIPPADQILIVIKCVFDKGISIGDDEDGHQLRKPSAVDHNGTRVSWDKLMGIVSDPKEEYSGSSLALK